MIVAYRSVENILLLMLCVVLAACSGMKHQANYPYQSEDGEQTLHVGEIGNECVIELGGTISYELIGAFKLAAENLESRKCASTWVVLSSIGGKVEASYSIGNIIREKGFNTRLSSIGGVCASSCGMLFIAGVKREARDSMIIGAHLGFHQITHKGNCVQPSAMQYKKLLGYASHLLPPEGAALFVHLVANTNCNSMASVSFAQLKEAGIITGELGRNE